MKKETGAAHLLLLVAALGLIGFIAISSTASFKDSIFNQLFPKKSSHASGPISGPIVSPTPTASASATPTPVPTPTPDTQVPTVKITSPLNGATVKKNTAVTIAVSATDNVLVSKVQVFIGTTLLCTDTAAPYSCAWKVPTGKNTSFNITAVATDSSNNAAKQVITVLTK